MELIIITKNKLRKVSIDIDGDCTFCYHKEEILFRICDLTKNVWSNVNVTVLTLNTNLCLIKWPQYIWKNKNWYNKVFHNPLEKAIIIIVWFVQNHLIMSSLITINVIMLLLWNKYLSLYYLIIKMKTLLFWETLQARSSSIRIVREKLPWIPVPSY